MSGLAPNTLGRLGHPFFDGSKHQARVSEVSENDCLFIIYYLLFLNSTKIRVCYDFSSRN